MAETAKKKAKKKAAKKAAKKASYKREKEGDKRIVVSAPKIETAQFRIRGTAPYVQCKFSDKALAVMRKTQEQGSVARKGRKKEPKDFNALFESCQHRSKEGWVGIPSNGIRAACVRACSIVGYKMTEAKLSVFVEADGYDATEGTPLVRISKGKPRHVEHAVRIQQTTDIRVRAMWDPGWEAKVRVRYDADQFSLDDVSNLIMRVGLQVGIGEGRPFSRSSSGMGWGTFEVVN